MRVSRVLQSFLNFRSNFREKHITLEHYQSHYVTHITEAFTATHSNVWLRICTGNGFEGGFLTFV